VRKLIAVAAETIVYVLIAAALVGLLAAYTVSRRGWSRDTLRKVAAQELANLLGGGVRLGPVTGDIWHGMTIHGFAFDDPSGRQALAAEQLHVDWDLPAVLRGKKQPTEAIRQLRLVRPYVLLVQDQTGRLNLERLYFLLTRGAKAAGPPPRLIMEIVDGALDYELRGPRVPPLLRRGHIHGLNLTLDARRPSMILVSASASAVGAPLKSASVQAGFLTKTGAMGLVATLESIDIPGLVRLSGAKGSIRLLGGRADGKATVYRAGKGAPLQWSASLAARGLAVRIGGATGLFWSEAVVLHATPRALWASAPRAHWGQSSASLEIAVQDYAKPSVALRAEDLRVYWPQAAAAIPAPKRRQIEAVGYNGWVTGRLEAVGPKDHLDIRGALALRAPFTVRSRQGMTFSAAGALLQVAAHDLARPAATFRAVLSKPALADLPKAKLHDKEHRPELIGLSDLEVTGAAADGVTVAAAEFSAESFHLADFVARNISGKVAVAGDVVRMSKVSLEAAGGALTCDGLAGPQQGRSKIAVAGAFNRLDLAALARWVGPENQELLGQCDGRFVALASDAGVRAEAFVKGSEMVSGRYAFRSGAALCRLEGNRVVVPWAVGENEAGPVAVSGEADLESRRLDVKFAVGPVEVGSAAAQAGVDGWNGKAWATGAVSGSLDDAKVNAEVVALRPAHGDVYAEAAYARVQGDVRKLSVPMLLACRDGAVVHFSGYLTDLRNQEPYGEVSGELRAGGFDLATVLSWAGAEPKQQANGLLQARARVTGTLSKPQAEGELRAAAVSYREYYAASLEGPFRLTPEKFDWAPISGVVEGIHVNAAASVKNFNAEKAKAAIEVRASTDETTLSRVMAVRRRGLELEGEGAVRSARLLWEGDRLVSADAVMAIQGANFGGLRASDVELRVHTEGDRVVLEPARLSLADGLCEVSGSYDTQARTIALTSELSNCGLQGFLSAASAAARAFMADENERRRAARRLESLSHRLEGPVSGIVSVDGPIDSLRVTANLQNLQLTLDDRDLPETNLKCVYYVKDKVIRDVAVEAQYGQGLITAEGSMALRGPMNLFVDGTALDVRELRQWLPSLPPATGTMQLTCLVTGDTDRPVVKGSCDITDLSVSGARLDLASVPVFTVQEGALGIDTMVIKRGPHEILLHGRLPFTWEGPAIPRDEPLEFRATFDAVDLATFRALASEYYRATFPERAEPAIARLDAQGVADGVLDVGGTLAEPRIAGVLEVNAPALKLREWSHAIKNLNMRASLAPADGGTNIILEDFSAGYDRLAFHSHGNIVLRTTETERLFYNDWHLTATVTAPEQTFAGGTVAKELELVANLDTVAPGKARLSVERGHAKLGPGKVVLKGGMDLTIPHWSQLHRNASDFSAEFDSAAVRYGKLFDGFVAGTARLTNPEPGQVAVLTSRLTLSKAQVALASSRAAAQLYAPPASVPDFGLDLVADLGQDVNVRGAGLYVPLQPAPRVLVLAGSLQQPTLRGFFTAKQGRASLPGGWLAVKSFDVGIAMDPGEPETAGGRRPLAVKANVRGQAERVLSQTQIEGRLVGPVHIYLTFAGQLPGEISVKATSDPPLAEEEIYAILGAEPFGGLATATSAADALSERFASLLGLGLQAGVFEPFEAELRSMLGLTEFQITFALNQPVEVRVGKYLLKDLLVSYQRALTPEERADWWLSVSYEVRPGTVVGYYTRSDGEKRFTVGRRRTW